MSGSLPTAPVTLQNVIPLYIYQEYSDDDNLQAFASAFNTLAQEYVTWFNLINLPVYTGAPIANELLDWVGNGVYGIPRPVIPEPGSPVVGPLNSWALNTITLNTEYQQAQQTFYIASDDIYKRCLTWRLYKGDGQRFNIQWLKRRIARFLACPNGTDFTAAIPYTSAAPSVSFATGGKMNIILPAQFIIAPILQAAIQSGILPLPFQYSYQISIQTIATALTGPAAPEAAGTETATNPATGSGTTGSPQTSGTATD